mmetsp:Transcript_79/g.190  ORF Transcript_79/g.190 Transcript_79/m.190 type:complete len:741 (+) Transcript_79:94-2316(+)|eukprot:CAMPEP_0197186730 /NCGR_PEP_ID=MMETSP1423-20130617/14471_1 /TAXON_ID=476441 /ORGANISM="Pseudo-nitzschia heimii, Strain UNC1101" /LENGTH=740 /DNA_ID=CAMNT_0042638123 /DNA_START=26 /DNA_END=2248 /DNA_ORIENTATION=+
MASPAKTIEDSFAERQAEALVTLLESFQPRKALKPHVAKLKALVKDLEFDEQHVPEVLTSATSSETTLQDNHKDDGSIEAIRIKEPEDEEQTQTISESVHGAAAASEQLPDPIVSTDEENDKGDNNKVAGGGSNDNNFVNNDDDHGDDNSEEPELCELIKPSTSYGSHQSIDSNTVLRSETFYLDTTSINTEMLMEKVSNNIKYLSHARRPGNENLSPNKPPTPMKSSSMNFRAPTESSLSQGSKSRTLPQTSSQYSEKYQDATRFLDDKDENKRTIDRVFGNSSILARILEFDGSLAAYYKNYDLIKGYKSPHIRVRSSSRFQRRHGTNQLAFVNRKFHSLIIGSAGLEEWKVQAQLQIEILRKMSRRIMTKSLNNESRSEGPTPLAKTFAIVIRNDAIEFEYLLSVHVASIQHGTSAKNDNGNDIFGMALSEYVKGGEENNGTNRSMGLPQDHPFLKCIRCWNAKEFYYTTFLAELAFNAVVHGALDVLSVLSSRHNTLYSTAFGPIGEQNLLGEIVAYVCSQPCCTIEISQGIRTLMVNQRFDNDALHAIQQGSYGNSLHLAAAKGDRELVDALLDIGCDPCVRCDRRAMEDKNTNNSVSGHRRGYFEHGDKSERENGCYPEEWARVRGHDRVVRLLTRRRKQLQHQRRLCTVLSGTTAGSSTIQHDDSNTADYDTVTANDTITADYDSNSSSSSDYDSEYDSEDDSSEERPTYDEDDSSSYDSDDETCLYNNDSYR